ncbi:hypothetical protein EVAR_68861_1 [Eumeta japonica]|uniref:Uncharacterized protein n=1 Tax=Eumeta variegata TaxID=151549 RepID=A0A4C1ZDB8_EUMVA|nr:hypothetical protein EVAR_68861_1 [Eumeta japonica]
MHQTRRQFSTIEMLQRADHVIYISVALTTSGSPTVVVTHLLKIIIVKYNLWWSYAVVNYNTKMGWLDRLNFTEHRREITAFTVAYFPVSDSPSIAILPFSLPYPLAPLRLPSVHSSLHQIFCSYIQKAGNALVTHPGLRVYMGVSDHLLSDGSPGNFNV